MAESTIITQPYKPDGSPSHARVKTTTIPETTYDNSPAQSGLRRLSSQGSLFEKYPATTKVLKSFASGLLSLRSSWSTPPRPGAEESTNGSELAVIELRKSESATAMEIYEKHQEDTRILKE